MTWIDVPDAAVTAGAPASPYLMRALRDNDEAIANANLTIGKMLDDTIGHVHGVGVRTYTYNFIDRVEVKAGFNDCVPFAYEDPTHAEADYCATLTADTYELDDLAAHIQTRMIAEVGGSPAALIEVVYDDVEGSPTRGLFVIRHTGSVEPRVLHLLFASGVGASECIGPSIGFAKLDRRGANAYAGDSGFSDGYTQDTYTPWEGGLLGDDAWVPGAFTAVKLGNNVISTRCFQNNAVSGSAGDDHIQDGTLTGDKTGGPEGVSVATIANEDTHDFTLSMPNGGAGRTPMVVPYTIDAGGAFFAWFSVELLTHTGGNNWTVRVRNHDTDSHLVGIRAY